MTDQKPTMSAAELQQMIVELENQRNRALANEANLREQGSEAFRRADAQHEMAIAAEGGLSILQQMLQRIEQAR